MSSFGAIDLYGGSSAISGTNLLQVDHSPLAQLNEDTSDVMGKQAQNTGDQIWNGILASISSITGIPVSTLQNSQGAAANNWLTNLETWLGGLSLSDSSPDYLTAAENFINEILNPTGLIATTDDIDELASYIWTGLGLDGAPATLADIQNAFTDLIDSLLGIQGSANNALSQLAAMIGAAGGQTIFDLVSWLQDASTDASEAWTQIENFLTTGDWSDLNSAITDVWDAIFGTPTPNSGSQILQSAIDGLDSLWNSIFGTTTPTSGDQILQTAIADLDNAWTALFGSSATPTTGSQVLQSSIDGLTALWNSIFGTTTPTSSNQILQTAIADLDNAWTALFGSSSTPTTGSQVLQSSIQDLENAWTALFGSSSTPTTGSQVLQSSVQDLSNAWTALFGSGSNPTTTSQILQASVQDLENAWTAIFGFSTAPATNSQILQSSIQNLENIWSNVFGTTTPTGSTPVQQSAINGLTTLWNQLFGTTTPSGSSTVQQSAITGLTTLWNQLFGTTTPTGSSTVQQSAITGLTTIWNDIFGTTTPSSGQQILQTAIQDLENAWTALFGSSSTPTTGSQVLQSAVQDLDNAWTALFGSSTNPTTSSTVHAAALPTNVQAANTYWSTLMTNLFGGSTPASTVTATALPSNVQSANTYWSTLMTNLFGASTPASTVQVGALPTGIPQGNISNLTTIWNAIFGTTTPTGASTVQQSAISGLTTLWNQLFGTTTPTGSSTVQQSAITGLQSLWNGLFGTTTPTSSTKVQPTSVANVLGGSSLGADVTSTHTTAANGASWSTRLTNDLLITSDVFHLTYAAGTSTDAPGTIWSGGGIGNGKPTWYSAWNDLLSLAGVVNSVTAPTDPAPGVAAAITSAQSTATSASTTASTANSTANTATTNISNTWSWLFGTTSPTSSSPVQSTKVATPLGGSSLSADLTALGNLLFGSPTVGSAVQSTALPTAVQSANTYWSTLMTNLFGTSTPQTSITTGAVPSGVPASKIANVLGGSNLGADVSSVNTTTTTHGTWFSQLMTVLGISTGGTSGTSIGNAISTAQSTATSASSAASSAASTASTASSNLTNTWSWLFGTTSPTSTTPVQTTKVANIFGGSNLSADLTAWVNNIFGSGNNPTTSQIQATQITPLSSTVNNVSLGDDLQTIADQINTAVGGGGATGTPIAHIATNLQALPQQNVAINTGAGATTVVYDAAAQVTSGTTVNLTQNVAHNYSITHTPVSANANYILVAFSCLPSNTCSMVSLSAITSGGVALSPSLLFQGTYSQTGNYMALIGVPIPNGAPVVTTTFGIAFSAYGASSISTSAIQSMSVVGWSSTSLITPGGDVHSTQPTGNSVSSSVPGQLVVQALTQTDTNSCALSGFNQTVVENSGVIHNTIGVYQATALLTSTATGTVTFNATSADITFNYWNSLILVLEPSPGPVVGSGIAQYRSSASTVSLGTGFGQFPSGYFDTTVTNQDTADLSVSSNAVTISLAGWYFVEIQTLVASITIGSGSFSLNAVVYKNGSIYNVLTGGGYAVNGFGGQYYSAGFGGSGMVYCNIGDVLTPGYQILVNPVSGGSISAVTVKGESAGQQTRWGVTLMNRSLL
jgi:hypothetical protein